ncbi:MAG: T9SS type A sorting domain-containing protein [Mariniphaga sp.]|nr:T9SS type A sorting domain-containing protein [Mariniphaga sp.]
MRLKIFLTPVIIGIVLSVSGQYQIPLFAPGNSGGQVSNNNYSVLAVVGQNAIGITQDNNNTMYFGLLAPLALITDAEFINSSNSRLLQNYPNPYRKFTTIPFELAKQYKVKLSVTDIMGRPVEIILNQVMPPGVHNIRFNADYLTPGIYIYHLEVEGQILVKSMAISK